MVQFLKERLLRVHNEDWTYIPQHILLDEDDNKPLALYTQIKIKEEKPDDIKPINRKYTWGVFYMFFSKGLALSSWGETGKIEAIEKAHEKKRRKIWEGPECAQTSIESILPVLSGTTANSNGTNQFRVKTGGDRT